MLQEIRITYKTTDGKDNITVVNNCVDFEMAYVLDMIDDFSELSQVIIIELYLDVRAQGGSYILQHSEEITHDGKRRRPENRRYKPPSVTTIKCGKELYLMTRKTDLLFYVHPEWISVGKVEVNDDGSFSGTIAPEYEFLRLPEMITKTDRPFTFCLGMLPIYGRQDV